MNKLFRLLVVLAVALAVPLQGAAAVAAGQCMAFGHHDQGGAMSHAGHGGLDGHEQHHQGHQDHGQHHGDPKSDSHHPESDASADHCAPCVACCAAAAISTPFQPFIAGPTKERVAVMTGKNFSGVAPETLDRPPLAL